jgi:hypothetical protein
VSLWATTQRLAWWPSTTSQVRGQGAETVSATATVTTGDVTALVVESSSYLNVGSVSAAVTNYGNATGSLSSASITGIAQGVIVPALGAESGTAARSLSTYIGNERALHNASATTDVLAVLGDRQQRERPPLPGRPRAQQPTAASPWR